MKIIGILTAIMMFGSVPVFAEQFLGNLSANPYDQDSTSNKFGAGSTFKSDGINNPYSRYGSPYSNQSATDRYATDAPKLFDQKGNFRGNLSTNQYDPDSTSNEFGRYGSRYSPDSLNNEFGAGNPYALDSPNNPYGSGWSILGSD